VAAVVITITFAWLNWRADTAVDPSSAMPSSAAQSDMHDSPIPAAPSEDPMDVLVLGDALAAGRVGGASAWPDILAEQRGWHLAKDVVARSGYLAAGRWRPFLPRMVDRLQAEMPELVILAGGYADLRLEGVTTTAIVRAVDRVVTLVREARPRARIVIVSPSATAEPAPRTVELAGALETYAENERITFVDVTGVLVDPANRSGAGGVHPSAAGHEQLADVIGAAIDHPVD
jgi:lysophospholipase L1-like esterase